MEEPFLPICLGLLMRYSVISFRLALRGLGPAPLALACLFLALASVQEPLFFRSQGLGLVWPSCAVLADFLTMAGVAAWLVTVRYVFGLTHSWVAGLGLLGFAISAILAGSLLCIILDLCRGIAIEPALVWNLLVRTLCVWAPMTLLAIALANCAHGTPGILGLLLGAFLVQITVHPVSMAGPGPGFANFLLTLLALAGSAAAAFRGRLASPARAH